MCADKAVIHVDDEYPRYNPLVKPTGPLHVDESHPLAQGLSLNLSSPDTKTVTNTERGIVVNSGFGLPDEVITERGTAFRFDGVRKQILMYVTGKMLNVNSATHDGYALFLMFKTRPPLMHPDGPSQNHMFNKNLHLWHRWDCKYNTACVGRGYLNSVDGQKYFPKDMIPWTTDINALPQWYTFGYSSDKRIGSRIHIDGRFAGALTPRFDVSVSNGELKVGNHYYNNPSWKGDILAVYEWYRALTDEEHASLASHPFQFLKQG